VVSSCFTAFRLRALRGTGVAGGLDNCTGSGFASFGGDVSVLATELLVALAMMKDVCEVRLDLTATDDRRNIRSGRNSVICLSRSRLNGSR
jgi:hypothetical protein